jgi:flagellar protein FlgJ
MSVNFNNNVWASVDLMPQKATLLGDPLSASNALATRDAALAEKFKLSTGEVAKIRDVSQQFESLFLDMVMKGMRKTVPESGLIDGGNAESIYEGMLDTEYAKMMSQSGGVGLAESISQYLLAAAGNTSKIPEFAIKSQAAAAYGSVAEQNAAPVEQAIATKL